MAISLVNLTQAIEGDGHIALAVPAGVQNGDLLFVFLAGSTNQYWSDPAGWTSAWETGANSYGHGNMCWRWANNEPASYTWTRSGCMVGAMYAYRGVNPANPFNNAQGWAASVDAGSVVTTKANCEILQWVFSGVYYRTWTPSLATERFDQGVDWGGGNSISQCGISRTQVAAGACGVCHFEPSYWFMAGSCAYTATFAIEPAATAKQQVLLI